MSDRGSRYRITDLTTTERPRERLATLGPKALSNTELVAILLRSGMAGMNALELARKVLQEVGGLAGLHRVAYEELCSKRGIGPAKGAQLKAAVELGKRLAVATPEERPAIHSPEDAASLLLYEMGALEQEHLRVLLLDTRNRWLRTSEVYRGSLNSSLIRVGEVFRDAVRANAAAVIVEAGSLLDIEVLDHLVIGKNCFVSLKARGLGFGKPVSGKKEDGYQRV